MHKQRFVILGNGGAALSAISAARGAGYTGEIHLISETDEAAYNPMLSPYYFKGKVPWDGCFPFGSSFYRDHDITCHFGVPVASLAAREQRVTLDDGRSLAYDRCLIATGAAPVVPPVPGLRESPRALTLRSSATVRKMEAAMQNARRALVLGASLVGIEMAEVLTKRGVEVVLLDVVDQVLPRGTHPSIAAFLRRFLEGHGVDVRLGCGMEGMEGGKDGGVVCHFAGDVIEEADLVVVSTGVRSSLAFVSREEVKVELGVLTDERMRTNVENLYAAGDASQALNLISGRQDWMGTWGSACYQGQVAGLGMAGKEAFFQGMLPENISPVFEWNYANIGDIQPKEGEVRHVACGDPVRGGYSLLAFRDDILVGANLLNCTHLAGLVRRAILGKWRCVQTVPRGNGIGTEGDAKTILQECTTVPWIFHRSPAGALAGYSW
ncbi:MAG: FAD-dependent oxidoreductase [Deltaproteobacteria bacterium]|nr:FAD-dependent oxidoreductase [Deltaproteobacteria bacterium]